MNLNSTYRIQFHKGFTFKDFEAIIPYLYNIGVKTVYASPIFESTPGSTHGYDVVDPLRINPEIGTLDELKELSDKLKKLGMAWLQDIVPNHMAYHPSNKWLMDVLEKGQRSLYAPFFDVIWNDTSNDRLMVPFLGDPLDQIIANGQLQIVYVNQRLSFNYGEQLYPLQLASWVEVAKAASDQKKCNELIVRVDALSDIDDFELYNKTSEMIKADFLAFFDATFNNQFLNGINQDKKLITKIAQQQHYRLCYWQDTDQQINFRRFFTVNGLICLNIQDEAVFNHYHQLIKSLVDQHIFQGLRVDHIDGLFDPEQYLTRLRSLAGENAYISVEKILEPGEVFPEHWPVQGSTGYDFLATVNNLFTNAAAERTISILYESLTGSHNNIKQGIKEKKTLILDQYMGGELENLYRLFVELKLDEGYELTEKIKTNIKLAIAALLIEFPVYRLYDDSMPLNHTGIKALKAVLNSVKANHPKLKKAVAVLEDSLLKKPKHDDPGFNERAIRFYQRCMQFTGPLMAKGVEDTLMYTYNRFIGHNEVGDSPASFGLSVADFHKTMIDRQVNWPLSMSATATHDTKRGEDVRARLNVLTDLDEEWVNKVNEWTALNADLKAGNAPTANDEYFIYQTIAGAYPMPGQDDDTFGSRLQEYLTKALREAKENSNWAAPNEAYEKSVEQFVSRLLDQQSEFWNTFKSFHKKIAGYGVINSLAQLLIKYTAPGIPDLYQGCEWWDLSLVDPDNRRLVDYLKREQSLTELQSIQGESTWKTLWNDRFNPKIKLKLINQLLTERNLAGEVFEKGDYIPLKVKGRYKKNVLAFARNIGQQWYVVAAPLHLAGVCEDIADLVDFDWEDTRIITPELAPLVWKHTLTNAEGYGGQGILVSDIFKTVPLALLKLKSPSNERGAGVLLHISSLPSPFGIGDVGPAAVTFADFLYNSRQKYWQMLPVNPVETLTGNSPYSATSAMAGNVLLISPELLADEGYLSAYDLKAYHLPVSHSINFDEAREVKIALLHKAYRKFTDTKQASDNDGFAAFKTFEDYWLDDYATYQLLKDTYNGAPWYKWPKQYKLRDQQELDKLKARHPNKIDEIKWQQYVFSKQWAQLKQYCNQKGITVFGDMPFYVNYDSADVWSQPQNYSLDKDGNMVGMAGVPPDYFSAEGQLWGMPVYRWNELKQSNYDWWIKRIKKNLEHFDIIRLDHFRAFADYWEVPGGQNNAVLGSWKTGPGNDFFSRVKAELGKLPFVAEDLGEITDAVYKLRDAFDLPGMRVIQFAFDKAMPVSIHVPHNYAVNCFAYSGTHDNNTIQGWYRGLERTSLKQIKKYTGRKVDRNHAYKVITELLYGSVAGAVILPLQDVLGLGEKHRMNVPATAEGNWSWRFDQDMINKKTEKYLRELVVLCNR